MKSLGGRGCVPQFHSTAWATGLQRRGVLAIGPDLSRLGGISSRSWPPSRASSFRRSRSRSSGTSFLRGTRTWATVPISPSRPAIGSTSASSGLDCRYCHASVEIAPVANVPPTQTCMNCHQLVKRDSALLAPIRDSATNGRPMRWIRVHKLPDYAYFTHRAHVTAGIGCVTCHGRVDEMETVTQMTPLSMSWCLDCHRNPGPYRRPVSEVTNMKWTPPGDPQGCAWRSSNANGRSIRRQTVRGATGDAELLAKSRRARGEPRIPRLSRARVPGGRVGAPRRDHPSRHDDAPGRLAVDRGALGMRHHPASRRRNRPVCHRARGQRPRHPSLLRHDDAVRPERVRPHRRDVTKGGRPRSKETRRTPRPSGPRARVSRRPCSASTIADRSQHGQAERRDRSPGPIS